MALDADLARYDGPPLRRSRAVSRFLAEAVDGATAPRYVESHLAMVERWQRVQSTDWATRTYIALDRAESGDPDDAHARLQELFGDLVARKLAERRVADYLTDVAWSTCRLDLRDVARSMSECHECGVYGVRSDDGRPVMRWDHKCEKTKLCPHAARAETKRLTGVYRPAIEQWLDGGRDRRLVYCVFTLPNVAPGGLAEGQREIIERFRAWCAHGHAYSPLNWSAARQGYGTWSRPPAPRSLAESIAGSLVTLEAPLSARGDWNVHLNVLLLVDGPLDFAVARQLWGADVYFHAVKRQGLTRSLLELIKYAAKLVDSDGDGAGEGSGAPPLVRWPPRLFLEWYDAQQGFRRTRSYGALYAVDRARWRAADDAQRYAWVKAAQTYDEHFPVTYCQSEWEAIPNGTTKRQGDDGRMVRVEEGPDHRATLVRAMRSGERVDFELLTDWLSRVEFGDWGGEVGYWVDLIPGNNFPGYWFERRGLRPVQLGPTGGTGPPHH